MFLHNVANIMCPYLANLQTAKALGIDRPKLAHVQILGHSCY